MNEAEDGARVIDVVSDVVCPWCYIGKRRLEAALQRLDGSPPQIHWHPFQLNPDLPAEGVDRRSYLEAKFGGARRADEIYARVRAAGASVGIAFEFDRIQRQPNTLDAHRLIAWAQARGDAEPLVERLFRAYFIEGRFIGDARVLEQIASDAGSTAMQWPRSLPATRALPRRPAPTVARANSASAACRSSSSTGAWRCRARRSPTRCSRRWRNRRPRRPEAPAPLGRRPVAARSRRAAPAARRRAMWATWRSARVWLAGPCRSSC